MFSGQFQLDQGGALPAYALGKQDHGAKPGGTIIEVNITVSPENRLD
jgi:hypothetical protein